ncbi:hypothetical protein LXD80_13695 [Enterobacter sp. ASE]|uniref:phage tail fiber protein n=1 Tax=Enterobacter sp. ASE TaxID=2905968 RepID=UPI001E5197CB|nr:hypothetical protein [Enterobacter sp. ASE]MCE3116847.1 hypothetical protein [Enterobacter sp. ASE]
MPEDFYAALMMRRALPTTTNIKTITAPGIYPVDAGNANAPVTTAGLLIVLPPTTRPTIKFLAADWNVYTLTGGNWQGLGTAAIKDIQTSKDDVTTGRVLVNGSAVAIRSVRAQSGATGINVADANNLPSNSVSFVYSTAANSPEITGSLLDFSGLNGSYNVQIAASYGGNGNIIKFRTYNGDAAKKWNPWYTIYHSGNKPTAGDVGAIPLTGSTSVTGIVRSSAELQSTSANSFRIGFGGYGSFWRNDGSNLYLMLTNKDDPWGSYNALRPFRVSLEAGEVLISKLNLSDFGYFDARYYTKSQSDAGYAAKTNVYTKAESNARYVQNVRVGAAGTFKINKDVWNEAPVGAFMTGWYYEGDNPGGDSVHYRPIQINVNGSWRTITA